MISNKFDTVVLQKKNIFTLYMKMTQLTLKSINIAKTQDLKPIQSLVYSLMM